MRIDRKILDLLSSSMRFGDYALFTPEDVADELGIPESLAKDRLMELAEESRIYGNYIEYEKTATEKQEKYGFYSTKYMWVFALEQDGKKGLQWAAKRKRKGNPRKRFERDPRVSKKAYDWLVRRNDRNRKLLRKIYRLNFKYDMISQAKKMFEREGKHFPDRAFNVYHRIKSRLGPLVDEMNSIILEEIEDNPNYFREDGDLDSLNEQACDYVENLEQAESLKDRIITMHEGLMLVHATGGLSDNLFTGYNERQEGKEFLDEMSNIDKDTLARWQSEVFDEAGLVIDVE